LRLQARPFLIELRDFAQETVHLVVMDQGHVAYVDKVECSKAVRMHSAVGDRALVHCTAVGKAMLAFMPQEDVERILDDHGLPARTPQTITDRGRLREELKKVRRLGYAVDDIENEEGIRCLGAPIFDHQGRPAAALSVSGPAYRLSMERTLELAEGVMETAFMVSQQLGYSR
jgi:DNA-binding IclR family transcriptional regulator